MNKDRIEGAKTKISGTIKEAVGNAVGDAKLETEGKIEKVQGTIQNAIGGAKDAIRKD